MSKKKARKVEKVERLLRQLESPYSTGLVPGGMTAAECRAKAATMERRAGPVLAAIADDDGIEKAIRKVWRWGDSRVAEQESRDAAVVGALQRLQDKAAEALDVLASIVGEALDPFPEKSSPKSRGSPAPTSRTTTSGGLTARDLDMLKRDPEVRRGFLEAQARMKAGTTGLTDEQRRVAARLGLNDPKVLSEISARLARATKVPPSNPNGLSAEQAKAARRMGISAVDPAKVRAHAEAMRSGRGVELDSKQAA